MGDRRSEPLLQASDAAGPSGGPSNWQQWTTVFALFLLATMCQACVFDLAFLFAVPEDRGSKASIRHDLHLTETHFGLLSSYIGIVPRLAAIIATGQLCAVFPARKRDFAVASGGVLTVGVFLYLVAYDFKTLIPAIVVINVGVGLNTPMNAIIIGDLFHRSARAMPIAVVVCADYLGCGLAGLAGALASSIGWRQAMVVYGLFAAASFAFAAAFIAPPPPVVEGGDFEGDDDASLPLPPSSDQLDRSMNTANSSHLLPPAPHAEATLSRATSAARAVAGVAAISVDGPISPLHGLPEGLPIADSLTSADPKKVTYFSPDGGSERERLSVASSSGSAVSRRSLSIIDGSVGIEEATDDEGCGQFRYLGLIASSPMILLIYLGGGIRYGAGMSIASYTPQFFALAYGGELLVYAVHATVSVVVCGTAAQLLSGYVTQKWLPGLRLPVLTCVLGAFASAGVYLAPHFNGAIGLLYGTWLLGEGWFVGVITTLQMALPPGQARDAGLGLFFASSVMIGAADVFATSQAGLGSAGLDNGEEVGPITVDDSVHHDDISGKDDGSHDDLYGGGGGDVDLLKWLLNEGGGGGDVDHARRTMVLSVSCMYLASGVVFALAMVAPQRWPCASKKAQAVAGFSASR